MEVLYNKGKKEFQKELDKLDIITKEFLISDKLVDEDAELDFVGALVYKRVKEVMRKNILENGKRLD
jgi:polyribonucleotide nucleotidyltransferase